jgi:hypothetical protein
MRKERIIKEGKWFYDGTIPCAIQIVERHIAYGSGDYEDPPEIRDDREGIFYYILYEAAGEREHGSFRSEAGPFNNIQEALEHAKQATHGTVEWN